MYDMDKLRRCMEEMYAILNQGMGDGPIHDKLLAQYQAERDAVEAALDGAGLERFLALQNLRAALELEKQIFWLSRGMELGKYQQKLAGE